MASRPRTLPASVAPVIVGTALAIQADAFKPAAAVVALLCALLIQIGSNFANDLGDFRRGTDEQGRVGPTRVTTAGLLTPGQVKAGMFVVFGLAALGGLYLIILGGWPILVVGVLSIVAAIAYTAGPLPFGYYGLGDLGTFVFFGLVAVGGTYYVQVHAMTPAVWLGAVAMGCLVTAILVVNNVRDADTDRQAGKRTLAVLLGRRGARGRVRTAAGRRLRRAGDPVARPGVDTLDHAGLAHAAAGSSTGPRRVYHPRAGIEQDVGRHRATNRVVCRCVGGGTGGALTKDERRRTKASCVVRHSSFVATSAILAAAAGSVHSTLRT